MSARLSRRNLIGGAWVCPANPIRPPWSLPEAEFVDACKACGDCVEACPKAILVEGRGGHPVVDFSRGACDFCGACAQSCAQSAFGARKYAPWRLVAAFGNQCLSSSGIVCRICAGRCDSHAIRVHPQVGGRAEPRLENAACTGCGACISICPAGAIRLEEAE